MWISIDDISRIGAIFITLTTVITILYKFLSPVRKMRSKIADHDIMLNRDYKEINENKEFRAIISLTLMAMLDMEITGNGVERAKEIREKLYKYTVRGGYHNVTQINKP